MKPVRHLKVQKGMKVSELVHGMQEVGFGAGDIAKASLIMDEMFKDKNCLVFLGVAGAMVPAGMKEIIIDLLEEVDVFVTTGANLTHDLIEALGENHYLADNSISDEELNDKGIDRIYNVLMKNEVYEKLEDFFEKNFDKLRECKSIREFLWKIGEILSTTFPPAKSHKMNSLLQKCWEKKIPVFCPGISDSGIGMMMWGRNVKSKFKTSVDVFADLNDIVDISWTSKKTGVIYVCGGLPKNFIQQAMQFSKGADYGIQITTDRPEPGGSSGAPLKEGISWGKMKKTGKFVDVFCDATIALPLIFASIRK